MKKELLGIVAATALTGLIASTAHAGADGMKKKGAAMKGEKTATKGECVSGSCGTTLNFKGKTATVTCGGQAYGPGEDKLYYTEDDPWNDKKNCTTKKLGHKSKWKKG